MPHTDGDRQPFGGTGEDRPPRKHAKPDKPPGSWYVVTDRRARKYHVITAESKEAASQRFFNADAPAAGQGVVDGPFYDKNDALHHVEFLQIF